MITKFDEFTNESLATDIIDKIKTIFDNGSISKEKYDYYISKARPTIKEDIQKVVAKNSGIN